MCAALDLSDLASKKLGFVGRRGLVAFAVCNIVRCDWGLLRQRALDEGTSRSKEGI